MTRSEPRAFGRVLHGAPPATYLPPVPDREPRDLVAADQRDLWRPAVDKERLWKQDIWVDPGPLTFARATVTLRERRLISKRPRQGGRVRSSRTSPGGAAGNTGPGALAGPPGQADPRLPRARHRRPGRRKPPTQAGVPTEASAAGDGTVAGVPGRSRRERRTRRMPIQMRQEPSMCRATRASGRWVKYWT